MERRKIQKTGGSTYIVSLPKKWVEGRLEEGDEVFLDREGKNIRLSLNEGVEKEEEVTINYEEHLGALLRKVIARYLVGYDVIRIKASEVIKEKDRIEKMVREKMMGMEVTAETSDEIVLQNLLKYSDLPTRRVLCRMHSIIKSMYGDVISSLESKKKDLLEDVIKRENEIDRLYLLGVRQLKSSIKDSKIQEKLGIDSKLLCLGYRMIFKSMERVSDHLKSISSLIINSGDDFGEGSLIEVFKKSFDIYKDTIDSFSNNDGELAENCIQKSKEVDSLSKRLDRGKKGVKKYHNFKSMINSVDRTRKLSRDIAEIVINLSAGEIKKD